MAGPYIAGWIDPQPLMKGLAMKTARRSYREYSIELFTIPTGGWDFEIFNELENGCDRVGDNKNVPYPSLSLAVSAACYLVDDDIDENS